MGCASEEGIACPISTYGLPDCTRFVICPGPSASTSPASEYAPCQDGDKRLFVGAASKRPLRGLRLDRACVENGVGDSRGSQSSQFTSPPGLGAGKFCGEGRHQDGAPRYPNSCGTRPRSDVATQKAKKGVPIFVCVGLSTLLYCGPKAFLQFSHQQRSKARAGVAGSGRSSESILCKAKSRSRATALADVDLSILLG